ncbi:MAG: ribonuclease III [Clostridia bacterium]
MIEKIEEALCYKFKNSGLLVQALTHSSYSKENYERLEFLGDSILGFVIAEAYYKKTIFDECNLSRARANLVSCQNLSGVFDKLIPEEDVLVGKSFVRPISPSVKSDIMEAIIGAMYLDGGMVVAQKFILKSLEVSKFFGSAPTDAKTKLQEYLQKNGKVKLGYVQNKKASTENEFKMNVSIFGKILGSGSGISKREAEQIAAQKALLKLKKLHKKAVAKGISLEKLIVESNIKAD